MQLRTLRLGSLAALVAGVSALAVAEPRSPPAELRERVALRGAGSTFAYPLVSKWIYEYRKVHPELDIHYEPVGSGAGIDRFLRGEVDFGTTDVPLTQEQLDQSGALHVPITIGAVAIVYYLPEVGDGLRLTPQLIADIFLGEVRWWDDPRIAQLNPLVSLPNAPIKVIHRSDSSGTTAVFTAFLAEASPAWRERVGEGLRVDFPTGTGARWNEGVAGQVRTTPGAIGYVELSYAEHASLTSARVRNQAGRFVAPTKESLTAAAAELAYALPEDMRLEWLPTQAPGGYPICSFSYLLLAPERDDLRGPLLAFVGWAVREGQSFASSLHYAPLPREVVDRVEQLLEELSPRQRTKWGSRAGKKKAPGDPGLR